MNSKNTLIIGYQLFHKGLRPLVTVSTVIITVYTLQRLYTFTVSRVAHMPRLITLRTLPR
jgi:hypothetical protein